MFFHIYTFLDLIIDILFRHVEKSVLALLFATSTALNCFPGRWFPGQFSGVYLGWKIYGGYWSLLPHNSFYSFVGSTVS